MHTLKIYIIYIDVREITHNMCIHTLSEICECVIVLHPIPFQDFIFMDKLYQEIFVMLSYNAIPCSRCIACKIKLEKKQHPSDVQLFERLAIEPLDHHSIILLRGSKEGT